MAFDVASVALGALLGAAGFVAKRFLTGEPDRERASLVSSYASIAATLKANGLTMEEVENLEMVVRTRRRRGKALSPAPQPDEGADSPPTAYWTQSAMNTRAIAGAGVADAQLEGTVAELVTILSEPEESALEAAQTAWASFRDRQVDFIALQVEGGSLEPLVRSSERESLTLQRIAGLRAVIDERKDL